MLMHPWMTCARNVPLVEAERLPVLAALVADREPHFYIESY